MLLSMKELYYTDASINLQARHFLQVLTDLQSRRSFQINSNEVALLLIDCQKFFLDKSSPAFIPSAPAIIDNLVQLQELCLESGIKVIHTRHIDESRQDNMMLKWWGNLLSFDNPLSELIGELSSDNVTIINKSQYDSFYNTTLDSILRKNNIKQLIICGVMTHLCCETTARVAFTRGYEVFFTIDGTATQTSDFHSATLLNLAHGVATPVLVRELLEQLAVE